MNLKFTTYNHQLSVKELFHYLKKVMNSNLFYVMKNLEIFLFMDLLENLNTQKKLEENNLFL